MNIHFKYRENYEKLIRLDGHVKQPTINSSIIALLHFIMGRFVMQKKTKNGYF